MVPLEWILWSKIVVTALAYCAPLLLLPRRVLVDLGGPAYEPVIWARLLGVAYMAVLLAYAGGLDQLEDGVYPEWAVAVGLVVNGGTCYMLLMTRQAGHWAGFQSYGLGLLWAGVVYSALGVVLLGVHLAEHGGMLVEAMKN